MARFPAFLLRSNRGSTIIMAMVAMAALALIGTTAITNFLEAQKQQNRQHLINSVQQIQSNLTELINSNASWNNTLAGNPAPTSTATSFRIFDGNNNLFYDATNPQSGFKVDGSVCPDTMPWMNDGSTPCLLHLDLKISQATCGGAPGYQITATYTYVPPHGQVQPPINWTFYNNQLSICRPAVIQTSNCSDPPPDATCPPLSNSDPNVRERNLYCTPTGWICAQMY